MKVADVLAPGRVVEIRGTVNKRDEAVRAIAENVTTLAREKANGTAANEGWTSASQQPAVLLQFSLAATSNELREVREILTSSPGRRPVQLLFDRASGNSLRLDAGLDFCVDLTSDIESKLSRWLVTPKPEQRNG